MDHRILRHLHPSYSGGIYPDETVAYLHPRPLRWATRDDALHYHSVSKHIEGYPNPIKITPERLGYLRHLLRGNVAGVRVKLSYDLGNSLLLKVA